MNQTNLPDFRTHLLMKRLILGLVVFLTLTAQAQTIELVELDELNTLISSRGERLKVINFWASWCGPCIKEMPHFDQVGQQGDVDLYFVSLDFISQQDKAEKMLLKQDIQSTALLLNEKDADKYIASINKDWTGAIPATLFVQPSGKKVFYEQALEKEELNDIINKLKSNE